MPHQTRKVVVSFGGVGVSTSDAKNNRDVMISHHDVVMTSQVVEICDAYYDATMTSRDDIITIDREEKDGFRLRVILSKCVKGRVSFSALSAR